LCYGYVTGGTAATVVLLLGKEVERLRRIAVITAVCLMFALPALASATTLTINVVTAVGTSGCPPSYPVVCPSADIDWWYVEVEELPPSPGIPITCWATGTGICIPPAQAVPQDVLGISRFTFAIGGGCGNITFHASTPSSGGVVAAPHGPHFQVSPDIDGSCLVDLADFGRFAQSYLTTNACCDYNCDGIVSLADFGVFASHYLH
jgi:hypothetical protein